MSEQDKLDTASNRYHAAAHAMQSGVAMVMNYDPTPTTPKHLRVGVNVAHSDHHALARLLMRKGLITEEEYVLALAEAMEDEVALYEKELSSRLGGSIHLG